MRHTLSESYLFAASKEELIRVDAISDGASNDGHPVEDNRRLIWVLEKKLMQDVEDYRKDDKGGETGSHDCTKRGSREKTSKGTSECSYDTHDDSDVDAQKSCIRESQ